MNPIRVFIVDDSAVVRQVVSEALSNDPELRVIGSAADPLFAMEKMDREWPDVILLDMEMPRMDGLTFLRKVMAERPTPVVICSSVTAAGAAVTLQALDAGALAIFPKPHSGLKQFLHESMAELIQAVKGAAQARLSRGAPTPAVAPKLSADAVLSTPCRPQPSLTDTVVAIGTSTGGTIALEQVLTALPGSIPGLLIVQHMPEHFTASFAARLHSLCRIEVKEAQDNDPVLPGRALIAPGGRHMLLAQEGRRYFVKVLDGPPVNRHRPSVDVLFRSVAKYAGKNAVGILMTGMGDDGARGLKEMRDAGAHTMAQDEESCVVYGMPKEAVRLGAAEKIVSLAGIAGEIQRIGPPGGLPPSV